MDRDSTATSKTRVDIPVEFNESNRNYYVIVQRFSARLRTKAVREIYPGKDRDCGYMGHIDQLTIAKKPPTKKPKGRDDKKLERKPRPRYLRRSRVASQPPRSPVSTNGIPQFDEVQPTADEGFVASSGEETGQNTNSEDEPRTETKGGTDTETDCSEKSHEDSQMNVKDGTPNSTAGVGPENVMHRARMEPLRYYAPQLQLRIAHINEGNDYSTKNKRKRLASKNEGKSSTSGHCKRVVVKKTEPTSSIDTSAESAKLFTKEEVKQIVQIEVAAANEKLLSALTEQHERHRKEVTDMQHRYHASQERLISLMKGLVPPNGVSPSVSK